MDEELIYRKVMCSNRNPKEKGLYQTNAGTCSYKGGNSWAFGSKSFDVQFWYEKVKFPSEEEKRVIVKEWFDTQQFKSDYPAWPSSFRAGFNKAIELIKG